MIFASQGVAGAASEHPLERVAEDPTRAGYTKTPTRMSGRDYKGGSGLKRGDNCTRRVSRQTACGLA